MCSSSGGQNCIIQPLVSSLVHETATYRYDDTRGCVMQFWPPDDEHMCSKHVEAWNKLIVKQNFFVPSWLITEINILRCTVSKTSKFDKKVVVLWLNALGIIFNSSLYPRKQHTHTHTHTHTRARAYTYTWLYSVRCVLLVPMYMWCTNMDGWL